MNRVFKYFLALLLLAMFVTSCKKEAFNGLSDVRPTIPVTVTNAIDYRPDPTVPSYLSKGGNIQVILSIPASSGRTIKEITKVAVNTTYTQIQSTGTTGFYTTSPIPANGTSVTFNTTLADYFIKNPVVVSTNPAAKANVELARRFYFLLTLDDGSTIIPQPVRVMVLD